MFLLVGLSVLGCDRREIRAYRVPRDQPADVPVMTASTPAPSGPAIEWDVPDGWVHDHTERQFRYATFTSVDGVEVAISFIAGDAGGLLANVNRWRGQVGLEPIGEEELGGTLEFVDGSHTSFRVLDITGSQRMLTAIVTPGDSNTWFVKSTDTVEQIDSVREQLLAFAGSLRVTSPSSAGATPQASPPQIDSAPQAASIGDWTTPEGWSADPNASPIVAAAWTTGSGTRVTVTPLAGDGGGVHQNIDMWRSQLGLEHSEDDSQYTARLQSNGFAYFDEQSADGTSRIAGWIVPDEGQTWFLKAIGSPEGITQEMENLESLLEALVNIGGANS
jgi:hypothetical protein